jgi:hypothetical protein
MRCKSVPLARNLNETNVLQPERSESEEEDTLWMWPLSKNHFNYVYTLHCQIAVTYLKITIYKTRNFILLFYCTGLSVCDGVGESVNEKIISNNEVGSKQKKTVIRGT